MEKLARQGDVLFIPVYSPRVGEKTEPSGIIARGAHTHRISPKDMRDSKQKAIVYLGWDGLADVIEVRETVHVIHEEHGPITLEPFFDSINMQVKPAFYKVHRAREFDIQVGLPRMVLD